MLNSLSSKKIPQKKTCYKILPTSGGTSQTNFYVHFQPILEGINFGKKKKEKKKHVCCLPKFSFDAWRKKGPRCKTDNHK